MSDSALKTLILPAEIKSRELDSRILVGVIAAQKGWRVIIGSKSPLNRRVWKYGGDVYICQTLTKRRENNLRLFGNLGLVNIGWDEEGLVYYGKDIYLSRRVSENSLALMDGVIAWGDVSKKDLDIKAKPLGLDVSALGNPRMDLLRPELRALYLEDAGKISDEYGDFVLINTNFPSVNPHETVGDARSKVMRADAQSNSKAGQRFTDMQTHRKNTLEGFFTALPKLARKHPSTTFILRPHPAESITVWQKACGSEKNIVISQKGSVIPWLMAAKGLLHNGCTTGVEYFLLGKSSIAYMPAGKVLDESPLPNGVSHHASSQKDMFALIERALKGTLKPSRAHKKLMDQYVSARQGALAAERAIEYCEKSLHNRMDARTGFWSYLSTYIYCALRQIHRSTRMGDPARDYIAKVFPKTGLDEVQTRAGQICAQLDLKQPVTVDECAENIFEIRPGNEE